MCNYCSFSKAQGAFKELWPPKTQALRPRHKLDLKQHSSEVRCNLGGTCVMHKTLEILTCKHFCLNTCHQI